MPILAKHVAKSKSDGEAKRILDEKSALEQKIALDAPPISQPQYSYVQDNRGAQEIPPWVRNTWTTDDLYRREQEMMGRNPDFAGYAPFQSSNPALLAAIQSQSAQPSATQDISASQQMPGREQVMPGNFPNQQANALMPSPNNQMSGFSSSAASPALTSAVPVGRRREEPSQFDSLMDFLRIPTEYPNYTRRKPKPQMGASEKMRRIMAGK